jgi:hypothetical protein
MKLVDLIAFLKYPDELERLFIEKKLDMGSEAIIICMEKELHIDSEIHFFEIEQTEGNLVFERNDIKYIELFPAYHAVEIVESYFPPSDDNQKIANRLLEYRINDA